MDALRQRYEQWVHQTDHGTYAESLEAYSAMIAAAPQLAMYGLQLAESAEASERVYGCLIFLRFLDASHETGEPVPDVFGAGIPVWIRLTRDEDEEVRHRAAQILARIRSIDGIPALCAMARGTAADRDMAAQVLCCYHAEHMDGPNREAQRRQIIGTLLQLVHDEEPDTRGNAVDSLRKAGYDTPEVRAALLEAFNDPEARVRAFSAEALGRLQERRMIPILEARLRDEAELRDLWWLYYEAVEALDDSSLLPAAEAGAEIVRQFEEKRGRSPQREIDRRLERLRLGQGA